jgi:cytochrome b subunit of formate dehydrogenase
MATEPLTRHSRRTRWFHAAAYLIGLPLIATGWWILFGKEGQPSPLARLAGTSDIRLHIWLGRGLAVLIVLPVFLGRRAIATFFRESLRADRGDGRWFLRLPGAMFTGRFSRHEGEFDPGQRIANLVIVLGLFTLTATGIALTELHGGSTFAVLAKIHKYTAWVVTAAILGHIFVAAGILPGYWGVWRSMHLGGKVKAQTAERIWPAWAESAEAADARRPSDPEDSVSSGGGRRT